MEFRYDTAAPGELPGPTGRNRPEARFSGTVPCRPDKGDAARAAILFRVHSSPAQTWRVGIDVGGTFTDLVALNEATGALLKRKVATTPSAPAAGVFAAVDELRAALPPGARISLISHSSTIATNALLGQMNLELPRIALLTTEGFRDVLEIGRQNRSEVYNLFVQRPAPLVAREDRLTVRERIGPFGEILTALDAASVDAAIAELRSRKIVAVAVGFLNAYVEDAHERAVGAAIAAALPGVSVTLSSEIDREYREYERLSTAVVNAALVPLVRTYLLQIEAGLRARGIDAPVYVMQSSGGMAAIGTVAKRPITIIESGPASGVIGAAFLARELGITDVLSFDMGGTTAKAGTIFDGEPEVVGEFEAAGKTHSGRSVKGSGYPVRFPFVDLAEISAGGGTIAWIDSGGALRVGPLSAGADPGPAAYGKGDRPTVSDANVVLGRLNPVALLGGAFPVHADRAQRAIAELAAQLDLSVEACAAGIVHLVDVEMAKVLRIVSVERGYDPRSFTMMAFGGGGPLHACALAAELDVPRIIVPVDPGLFSAYGLLAADVRSTFVRSIVERDERVDARALEAAFVRMQAEGADELRAQGVMDAEMAFVREYDMRYYGQSFELSIGYETEPAQAVRAFGAKHARTYGYDSPGEAVEFVNARLIAIGRMTKPPLAHAADRADERPDDAARATDRAVWTGAAFAQLPVYRREALRAGNRMDGPCVIEQYDSCTFVAPGWHARVDGLGNLDLERVRV
ncbi:MAG: hydantoinase/oxoprolinase family protein [Candidatus Velthaea sp.]